MALPEITDPIPAPPASSPDKATRLPPLLKRWRPRSMLGSPIFDQQDSY